MWQLRPLSLLQTDQSVSNPYVLSAQQSSGGSGFNVFYLTQPVIEPEPPISRMSVECSSTTLPGRENNRWMGFSEEFKTTQKVRFRYNTDCQKGHDDQG